MEARNAGGVHSPGQQSPQNTQPWKAARMRLRETPVLIDWSPSEIKPQFFKRTFFLCSYSPEALAEGGQCRLEVPKERLGREAWWGDVEKQPLGDLHALLPLQTKTAIPATPGA